MVAYELKDNVAIITMDDGKANVVSLDFQKGMTEALDKAEQEAKAVLIKGREGFFSAGFDLKVFEEGDAQKGQQMVKGGGELLYRLFTFPLPTVAACTGHALAAGCLILSACDYRYAAKGKGKIGMNETAINMVLPIFGIEIPKYVLDQRYYDESLVQATIYDVERAQQVGYLNEVVEGDVVETAFEKAKAFSQFPAKAYHGNKMLTRQPHIDIMKAAL